MSGNASPPDPGRPNGRLAPVITWRSALVDGVDCSTCKLVGLVLSLYMNERGGSAFPSVRTLAGDCSLSESTIREHLNGHLHSQGWLVLIKRGGLKGDRRQANEWQASDPTGRWMGTGVPHREPTRPHRETASTPPGNRDQVVQEQVHEQDRARVACSGCGERFATTDDLADHQEAECEVLNAGDDLSARDRANLGRIFGEEVPA